MKKLSFLDRTTRDAAVEAGFEVLEVTREVPHGRNGRRRVELRRCIQYRWPPPGGPALPRWRLLQRPDRQGQGLPRDWELDDRGHALDTDVRSVLVELAQRFDGEFMELECDGRTVSVFWEEWGGRRVVTALASFVQRLVQRLHSGNGGGPP